MTPENEGIKAKIVDTSQKIQEVLLLLLSDNDDLRGRLDKESERSRETAELREKISEIASIKKYRTGRLTGIDYRKLSTIMPTIVMNA